ncbi:MAG TPA: cupredoxin domain-containing protein [Gaiellaceae bacterium]|jgi:uncharacterized cupredoxin-like copper-binding protein|nr:cupredoxin domain-containing protein [Gaiellaceae bacterium]
MKKRIALLTALAVVGGSVFAGVGTAATHKTKAAKVVKVTATDFKFKLSLKTFKKGVPYKFVLTNKGTAFHNFDIQGLKATKIIAHNKTASFTVTFKKAKKYQYVCDVPRHIELGMAGYITVR